MIIESHFDNHWQTETVDKTNNFNVKLYRPDTTYIPSKQMLMSVRSIVTITRGYDDYVYLIPILPVIPGTMPETGKGTVRRRKLK